MAPASRPVGWRGAILAATLAIAAPAQAAPAPPAAGPYADAAVESTGSKLEFTVNAAGTRIARGAILRSGFPCAPRTVRTTERIPIVDASFTYRGPVERTSGRAAGTLRWSGTWTREYDVDGALRLRKGDCSSGEVSFAAMAVLPSFVGLQATSGGGGGVNLTWPAVQGAAYYYVMRSTVSGGPYPYEAYTTATQHSDQPPAKAAQYFYFVRAFDAQGAALANSNEASVFPFR